MAETFHLEFGDLPESYYFYASVARSADMVTAARMAAKLLQWPAPADARADAQEIMDRQALVGKTLNLTLTAVDGTTVDLARQAGKLTILYAWDAKSPNSLGLVSAVKKTLPADAQVIYFSPRSARQELAAMKRQLEIPGPLCYESAAGEGAVALALKLRRMPCVFVLDRAGKLAAFGPAEGIAAAVAAASGAATTNL